MNAEVLFYLMACTGLYLSYLLLRRYEVMTFWAFFELLLKMRYRFVVHGLEHVPHAMPLLLLGNHVSWLDWFVVQLPIQRRISFMMDKNLYHKRIFNRVLRKGEVIPISPRAFKDSFLEAAKRMKEDNIIVIFPEGEIARGEDLGVFHKGYEIIAQQSSGKIVPFFIDGMQGSLLARHKGNKNRNFFSRREVHLSFAPAVSMDTKADEVQTIVQQLKDNREIK
jgi:acyl-[acyl-carrier-protein]-phospholipid O-acyltransferase/long-chain-fatty-acid--[acyl-carrier-protein] ligase